MFFSRHEYSHEKCSEIFLEIFEPLFCGSENSAKFPPKFPANFPDSVWKLGCIVKGEGQESPLSSQFSWGSGFSQERLFSRNIPCKPTCLYNAPSLHAVEPTHRRASAGAQRKASEAATGQGSQLPRLRRHSDFSFASATECTEIA